MNFRSVLLIALLLPAGAFCAEKSAEEAAAPAAPAAPPAPEKKMTMRELVEARMKEEAKKQALSAPPSTPAKPAEKAATTTPVTSAPAKVEEPPTVLPKVEVRRDRITELDHEIAKEEHEIAREKKNTKPTEVDNALNDSKVAKTLSIFGGESSSYRASIAKERVSLMEEERDILEAMKSAKTKAEKAELQKQLDELRALRRDLEKSLR